MAFTAASASLVRPLACRLASYSLANRFKVAFDQRPLPRSGWPASLWTAPLGACVQWPLSYLGLHQVLQVAAHFGRSCRQTPNLGEGITQP